MVDDWTARCLGLGRGLEEERRREEIAYVMERGG